MKWQELFWAKVAKSDGECWFWKASLGSTGYGQFSRVIDGKLVSGRAHRISYELIVGPVPAGLQLDHLCRNRTCVNPAHLEVVTSAENTRRGRAGEWQRVKTACPQGHPYSKENTTVGTTTSGTPQRKCKACNLVYQRAYRAKKRALM